MRSAFAAPPAEPSFGAASARQPSLGLEATARIRESTMSGRRVPVIALTAAATERDRERCLAAGMDGYLSKPISPEMLLASLAAHTRDLSIG